MLFGRAGAELKRLFAVADTTRMGKQLERSPGTIPGLAAAALAVLACATVAPAASASGRVDRQMKREAEVILLSAPRRLAHFEPGLIDPQTGLLRTNTRASCTGLDAPVKAKHHLFRCVVSHGETHLIVRYTAVGRFGASFRQVHS